MKKFWIIIISIVVVVLIVYLVNKFLFTKKIAPSIAYGNSITNPPVRTAINLNLPLQ